MQEVPRLEVITTDGHTPVRCFLSEDKGSYVPYHYHPALELIYVLQGSMQFAVTGDSSRRMEFYLSHGQAKGEGEQKLRTLPANFRQVRLPECKNIPALTTPILEKVFKDAAKQPNNPNLSYGSLNFNRPASVNLADKVATKQASPSIFSKAQKPETSLQEQHVAPKNPNSGLPLNSSCERNSLAATTSKRNLGLFTSDLDSKLDSKTKADFEPNVDSDLDSVSDVDAASNLDSNSTFDSAAKSKRCSKAESCAKSEGSIGSNFGAGGETHLQDDANAACVFKGTMSAEGLSAAGVLADGGSSAGVATDSVADTGVCATGVSDSDVSDAGVSATCGSNAQRFTGNLKSETASLTRSNRKGNKGEGRLNKLDLNAGNTDYAGNNGNAGYVGNTDYDASELKEDKYTGLESSLEKNRINLHYTSNNLNHSENTSFQVFGSAVQPIHCWLPFPDNKQKTSKKQSKHKSESQDKEEVSSLLEISTRRGSLKRTESKAAQGAMNASSTLDAITSANSDSTSKSSRSTKSNASERTLRQGASQGAKYHKVYNASKANYAKSLMMEHLNQGLDSEHGAENKATHGATNIAERGHNVSTNQLTNSSEYKIEQAWEKVPAKGDHAKVDSQSDYMSDVNAENVTEKSLFNVGNVAATAFSSSQQPHYLSSEEQTRKPRSESPLPLGGEFVQLDATGDNCVLFNSDELHTTRCQFYNCSLVVQIPDEFLLSSLGHTSGEPLYFALALASPECLQRMQTALAKLAVLTLSSTSKSVVEGKELRFKQALYTLLECLLEVKVTAKPLAQSSSIDAKLRSKIYPIINMLNSNFRQHITLEQVANQIHVHPNYFCRIFKQVVGQSFHAYLTEIRLCHIYQELISTSDLLEDIVQRNGINMSTYFYSQFRRRFGISTSEIRKRYQSRGSN